MSKSKTWRDRLRPKVAEALAEAARMGLDGAKRVRFLRSQLPASARGGWIEKVWRSEIRVQLGRVRPKPRPPADPRQPTLPGLE